MRELDLQIDYWNRVGPAKPFAHPVNLARLNELVPPDSRILDFGCGYGRALGILHSHGYRNLVGTDPAPAMIAAARNSYPEISFSEMRHSPHTGLPTASVDTVLLFAVLTAVPGNEGQRAIVDEIARVLRPGGVLYISDMWLQTDARNVERYARDQTKYGVYGVFDLAEGVTVRHHDREWIKALASGFDKIAVDDIDVLTMNKHPATAFQWFGRKRQEESC